MKKIVITLCLVALCSCGQRGAGQGQTEGEQQQAEEVRAPQQGGITELTEADFLVRVADFRSSPDQWDFLGQRPAVVDFYAVWCGPCKTIAPSLDRLAREFAGRVDFYKVDVDKEPAVAVSMGVTSMPTLFFIPLEGEPKRVVGVEQEHEYRKLIEKMLTPA